MKKKMISGLKPTGKLHIGSYLGALLPFTKFQDDYDLSVFIANLHCITMPIEPEELKENLKQALGFYLASGLDPDKVTIFLQSDIPEHAQLGFILSCNTYLGELNRMTQYKDKKDSGLSLSAGFYTYPTLMAADILIHDADFVPVGEDQKQHVELARNIAERFNNKYGEVFKVPEPVIPKVGSKIMHLQDPNKKMSKSDTLGKKGIIYLEDSPKVARKKIMSAITDTVNAVNYDPELQPGISNLLTIYAALENISPQDAALKFKDLQYGAFKKEVADRVCEELEMLQTKYQEYEKQGVFNEVLTQGKEKAKIVPKEKLNTVQQIVGMEILN